MATQVNTLQWDPYPQEGVAGALIATVVIDASIDTNWVVPTVGQYNRPASPQVWADGVIISNDFNNGSVAIRIGSLASVVPPFQREAIALSASVGAQIQIALTMGTVQLLFYKGQPPINPQIYNYQGAAASVIPNLTPASNVLLVNVPLILANTFFTGPRVAQGNIGIWAAMGTITIGYTAAGDDVTVKLWDGTTVIADTNVQLISATGIVPVSLSGFLATPAGDLRMSAACNAPGTASILAVPGGGSSATMASVLTVFRVA